MKVLPLHTLPVVRIQLLMQGEDSGGAPDVMGEQLGLVVGEGAAEEDGPNRSSGRMLNMSFRVSPFDLD